MRHSYRSIAVAIAFAVSTSAGVAVAQDSPASNPARRAAPGDVFDFGGIRNQDTIITGSAFANPSVPNGFARSARTGTTHITPVPEPSQWAMMLAGLALVGFIVRRNGRNNKKDD